MIGERLGAVIITASVVLACSGGSGGGGGTDGGGAASGNGALTAETFSKEYCRLTTPCCTKRGVTSDVEACAIAHGLGYLNNPFDPVAGQRCLSDLERLAGAATFCSDGGGKAFEDACSLALAPTGTGTKAPGEACERTSDCAPSPEGRTECSSDLGSDRRACRLQVRAKEGDECASTKAITDRFASISSFDAKDPKRVGVCFESDDLYCASGIFSGPKTCKKRIAPGGDCRTDKGECAGAARCERENYTCALLLEVGARCEPGAIGSDDPCVRSAYCDRDTKVCTANAAPGAPCKSSAECGTTTGSSCDNGTCRPATNAFSCFD